MDDKEPVPTILYLRQSMTREQSESLASNEEVCREAAPRMGARIVKVVKEPPSTSGYKDRGRSRPKFPEVLDALRNGEGRAVMAYKSDRFSRGGGPGWAPLFEAFEEAGLDPDRAVLTPTGWLSEFEIGIRATMDREESKKLSDRMLDVRAREARAGKPRVGGLRPYGFSCSGVDPDNCTVPGCPHDGNMSIISNEAAIIREMAERLLAGETLYSLVQDLNARHIPTLTGREEWNYTVLRNILRNPRTAGLRSHNGEVVAQGTWPGILDRDTWERLVHYLDNREVIGGRRRGNGRSYVLVGVLFCGRCGAKLRSVQKHYKSVTGEVTNPRAYACRKMPNTNACAGLQIRAEPVEKEVKKYVIGRLADPRYRQGLAQLDQAHDDTTNTLADQLDELENQLDLLLDAHLRKKVSKARYDERYDAINEAIEKIHHKVYSDGPNRILRDLPTSVEELSDLWESEGITFQRQLIDLVLHHIVVKRASGTRAPAVDRLEWHPKAQ